MLVTALMLVVLIAKGAPMLIVRLRCAVAPIRSTTLNATVYAPASVGVPLISPLELKVRPGGMAPADVHVYGLTPPDTDKR